MNEIGKICLTKQSQYMGHRISHTDHILISTVLVHTGHIISTTVLVLTKGVSIAAGTNPMPVNEALKSERFKPVKLMVFPSP